MLPVSPLGPGAHPWLVPLVAHPAGCAGYPVLDNLVGSVHTRPMPANILATVTAASDRESAARRDLEAAILVAHGEGHSNREIAKACNLSHERVRQLVNAAKPQVDEAKVAARLAELDRTVGAVH